MIGTLYRPPCNNVNEFIDNLDSTLECPCFANKHFYLMGDFNIDLDKSKGQTASSIDNNTNIQNKDKLLNTFSAFAIHPCINKPTRITTTSSTLIDNIFTNTLSKRHDSGILYCDVSDHLPIFTISSRQVLKTKIKPKDITYRKETVENIRILIEDLAREEWHDLYRETDVNIVYEKFINKLTFYYEKNIPTVKQKQRKQQIRNPWITVGIFHSIQTRNDLYKSYLKNPSEENNNRYTRYRNILTKLIRTSKKLYYSNRLNNAEGDSRSTWKIINEMINKKRESTSLDNLNINGKEITNSEDVSKEFNSFFTRVGPELASKINSNDNTHFSDYLTRPLNKNIFFNPTDEAEIIKVVKSFQPKKSSGYDGISMKLLKQIVYFIAAPLVYIFNLSLSTGICPTLFKIAKVIPIFKKDDPTQVTNYRPISLLPAISKVLEKIVYKRLISFLLVNNILNSSQFGFRKNFSTEMAIIQLVDKIINSLSKKEHIIAIFMDLSKAFDTIDHNILLYKLNHYGVRGIPLSWFKSYLSDRRQYVFINNTNSSLLDIQCGVPQGSILGPLLFLVYVNDIIKTSNILSFVLFADDTNIFLSDKNLMNLITILNIELNKLSSWFKCNKLSLNINKTNYMLFQTTHLNVDLDYDIKIDNIPLDQKESTKFLGITIDKNLSWNQHLRNLSSKIAKGIGVLHKMKYLLPERTLLSLYNTLILPYIIYCNIAWGNCSKSKLDNILLLQKKAVRICTHSGFLDHTDPLFYRTKILKVHDIHDLQTSLFMFKYVKEILPPVFKNFFSYNKNIHSYPTRACNNIHLKPQSEAVGTRFFRIFRTPPERHTNTTYISDVIEGRELEKSRLYPTDNTQILVVYLFFRVRILLIISRERCRTSAKRE